VKRNTSLLNALLANKSALIELISVAIVLALGIEFVASAAITALGLAWWKGLLLGAALVIAALALLAHRLFGSMSRRINMHGFFLYDVNSKRLLPVPRYRFGDDLADYLSAAFAENEALKVIWENQPPSMMFEFDHESGVGQMKECRGAELVSEATEYFILDRLSTHLTDYFNHDRYAKDRLREFSREDVPDILLKNRFMELFSKPMDQRPHFVEDTLKQKGAGTVVMASGKGGVRYERFDLVLPKNALVHRLGDGSIEISTSKFKMRLAVDFSGCMTVLPQGYTTHYLGLGNKRETRDYQIETDITVEFKARALFSVSGWEYYRWVDSFLESFEADFSKDDYFVSIGWEAAYTVIACMADRKTKKAQQGAAPNGGPATQSADSDVPEGPPSVS
jgi:hypothetical protein